MRLRALLTLFLGVIVAGSAVIYTHVVMKAPTSEAMRDVVLAKADIAFGHVIDAEMLAVHSWPASSVPAKAFASLEEVLGNDERKPRRAKRAIAAGDLIVSGKISDFGEQVTITQRIDPGMRAVAIRVNDVTGVAGFVAPSDRVDVTLTRTVDQSLTTSTILQGVQVLGIDQAADGAGSKPSVVKTVTVQVKPADAQKLALAQQAGTLSLSLRHIDAGDQPLLDTISVGDLTDEERPKRKVKRPVLPSIVVNRGGERTTIEVPSG
jgi:pilus assembly protein CpaB